MSWLQLLCSASDRFFNTWHKENHYQAIIKLLIRLVFCSTFVAVFCAIGWMRAPSHLTLYIPPDISSGATLNINEIPAPLIYSFGYQVWQEINAWQTEGTTDYAKNIQTYSSYLTPDFKAKLQVDLADLNTLGQLQRQRFLQGMSAFNTSNVKRLSDNTWEVDLTLRLTEYTNHQVVKDVEMLYPLKIIRIHFSQRYNPYNLQLAGFVSEPVRLKTYS